MANIYMIKNNVGCFVHYIWLVPKNYHSNKILKKTALKLHHNVMKQAYTRLGINQLDCTLRLYSLREFIIIVFEAIFCNFTPIFTEYNTAVLTATNTRLSPAKTGLQTVKSWGTMLKLTMSSLR